jgi:hypothetical protein
MKTEERIKELEARFQAELTELKKELKSELEVGKWYFAIHGTITWIVNPIRVTKGRIEEFYGTNDYSGWKDDAGGTWGNISECKEFRLATNEEVFEALKKEAINRGFKEGAKYSNWLHSNGFIKESCYKYDIKENSLSQVNNGGSHNVHWIFKDGKWAEIIKDKIMIGGFVVKKDRDSFGHYYSIGCKMVRYDELSSIKIFMERNKFKEVCFDAVETDLETINKILNL